ncbi:aminoglycoside phosphotransferase family protein [Pseudactinotalea sp.]|uniref:aminoglycoside phosphotransferase family protein n=1 Tax=Pseudactinotalea sp. TaxID=1926260 RepID=UPI003B3A72F1
MARIPAAEVDVTPELVRTLLADQHPDLADLPITPFANGWDNAMLRLGEDLLVRMPRRALAAELVEHEQVYLPVLASRLPTAVPAPVRVGRPALGYPWSWSVLRWQSGHALGSVPLSERAGVAVALGEFLAALHTPAPEDVWQSPYRGGSLRTRADVVAERTTRYAPDHAERLMTRWHTAVDQDDPPGPRLWVHGDLHPLNVLVEGAALAAVIDWGDVTAGDPACDLAIAWLGFERADGAALRETYVAAATHHLDLDLLWTRAEAWAHHLTMVILDASDDHPELAAVGRHGLFRLMGD